MDVNTPFGICFLALGSFAFSVSNVTVGTGAVHKKSSPHKKSSISFSGDRENTTLKKVNGESKIEMGA